MAQDLELPQANSLGAILQTVRLVQRGYKTPADIANHLGMVERQGSYYLTAAALLDLINLDHNNIPSLTRRGQRVTTNSDNLRKNYPLHKAIMDVDGVQVIVNHLKNHKPGYTETEIADHLSHYTSLGDTTKDRRLATILAWLRDIGFTYTEGDRICYDHNASGGL